MRISSLLPERSDSKATDEKGHRGKRRDRSRDSRQQALAAPLLLLRQEDARLQHLEGAVVETCFPVGDAGHTLQASAIKVTRSSG